MTQAAPEADLALIVCQRQENAVLLARRLTLLLNYRYGLQPLVAHNFIDAFRLAHEHRARLRLSALVWGREPDSRTAISALSFNGEIPLLVLVPRTLLDTYHALSHRVAQVGLEYWEKLLDGGLEDFVETTLTPAGMDQIAVEDAPPEAPEDFKKQLAERLQKLNALPSLPQLVLRILTLVQDPESSAEALEEVIRSDPAMVQKLLQVVQSPTYAGAGHKGGWTLREAMVRLGRRQVAAIAVQIELVNQFVRPADHDFDLRRFWEHSLGCALIADRLLSEGLLPALDARLDFDEYWIAALLHDCGKAVLGYYFWDHYAALLDRMQSDGLSCHQAERQIPDTVPHEHISRLLLLKSGVATEVAQAVGSHHSPGDTPSDLVCLIHLADNLCKELELGCTEGERSVYSGPVLRRLDLDSSGVKQLRRTLAPHIVEQIRELTARCLASD